MTLCVYNNMKSFVEDLFFILKTKIAFNKEVWYKEDNIHYCMGYDLLYIYFDKNDNEENMKPLSEDYGLKLNMWIDINTYSATHCQALDDIIEIVNWYIANKKEDMLLLDECSHLLMSRKRGVVYYDKEYEYYSFANLIED